MLNCILSSFERRYLMDCNYNLHVSIPHYNRAMDCHDLIYLIDGEWEIWQDDTPYLIHSGDMLFLSANHHHYGKKSCVGTARTMYAHIPAISKDYLSDETVTARDVFFFPTAFSLPENSVIPELFDKMIDSYWSKTIHSAEQASAYLSLMLCEISQLFSNRSAHSEKNEMIERLLRTIENAPNRFFTNDEMCDLIHVSRKTLHNYFMEVTGQSPRDYQISAKLAKVKNLVDQCSGITLKELAMQYGFCDEYYLSKLFKMRYGYSPKRKNPGR